MGFNGCPINQQSSSYLCVELSSKFRLIALILLGLICTICTIYSAWSCLLTIIYSTWSCLLTSLLLLLIYSAMTFLFSIHTWLKYWVGKVVILNKGKKSKLWRLMNRKAEAASTIYLGCKYTHNYVHPSPVRIFF